MFVTGGEWSGVSLDRLGGDGDGDGVTGIQAATNNARNASFCKLSIHPSPFPCKVLEILCVRCKVVKMGMPICQMRSGKAVYDLFWCLLVMVCRNGYLCVCECVWWMGCACIAWCWLQWVVH